VLSLVVSLAFASVLLLALSSFSFRVINNSRVQDIADAAALAGAIGGEHSARQVAAINGATLCGFKQTSINVAARVCLERSAAWSFARSQQLSKLPTLIE